uniref:Tr-type G domain-containing protein n=1 Tax=Hymenolepis diminuta TaxID=6216 RepID=A0A0R3SRM8_HYMDI
LLQRVFVAPSESDLECLSQCLTQRLLSGQGECFIEIGVGEISDYGFLVEALECCHSSEFVFFLKMFFLEGQDPGISPSDMTASEVTLRALAEKLNAHVIHLRDRNVPAHPASSNTTTNNTSNPAMTESSTSATNINTNIAPSKKKKKGGRNSGPANNSTSNESNSLTEKISPSQSTTTTSGGEWIVKDFLLRQVVGEQDFIDIRVAVVGNVDAGKSTMLGVLTHGELDNGRGKVRQYLFRHKHELESGRTSSVGNDILGFDADGKIVNRPVHGKLDWAKVCQEATKVITFIDLAGHERYLKTTVYGLTGFAPDFVMLMIGANAGIIGMTKEHLGLALALSVPVFVVVTKIDMCPPSVLNETLNLLFRILKSPGCRKMPLLVSSQDDVVCSAINFTSERMCPVFLISNVTGANLEYLKSFLNLLSAPAPADSSQISPLTPNIATSSDPNVNYRLDFPASFQIDELFTVQGVGSIVSGTCMSGIISINDTLNLGPDTTGRFFQVLVKSIQRKRLPVNSVRAGQTASFSLKKPRNCNELRRGMVLLAKGMDLTCCMHFTATVLVLHHPTTISVGYQAMVHAGPIRQTATILSIGAGSGEERLRTGDKAEVHFAFINHPEYLRTGVRLIFREGKTKAVGTVNRIVPYQPVLTNITGNKSRKAQKAPSRQPVSLPIGNEVIVEEKK